MASWRTNISSLLWRKVRQLISIATNSLEAFTQVSMHTSRDASSENERIKPTIGDGLIYYFPSVRAESIEANRPRRQARGKRMKPIEEVDQITALRLIEQARNSRGWYIGTSPNLVLTNEKQIKARGSPGMLSLCWTGLECARRKVDCSSSNHCALSENRCRDRAEDLAVALVLYFKKLV
jgi:hypothetical protein